MKFRTVLLLLLLLVKPAQAEDAITRFDHSLWDQFLKQFVNEKGEVNYREAQKTPERLNVYLEKLKVIPEKEFFEEWPREERIALLINAYNAGVVKLVLKYYPIKTLLAVPGAWDESIVAIGSNPKKANLYSLNYILNELLRFQFHNEKVLFAVSSGAKDSPRLRPEAYTSSLLEGQIYLAAREFVNDKNKNRIVPGSKKIVISSLFKWYEKDFLLNWGNSPKELKWEPEQLAVLSFLAHYLEDPATVEFLKEGSYKLKYKAFDWRLNDWAETKKA